VDRIAIIGCGGSGKSHLARELGASLGITPVHLDTVYYDKDWNPLPKDQFAALQRDLVSAPRWVIDGNYASSLPIRLAAADTVIFLDLPARTCLWGIAQRRLRHGGGQHQAIGVYDRITWGFVRYILGYRRSMAPRVRALITRHAAEAEVIVLRSRRYLAGVTVTQPAGALSGRGDHRSRRGGSASGQATGGT
jgi:adenylate kinase family enzyme